MKRERPEISAAAVLLIFMGIYGFWKSGVTVKNKVRTHGSLDKILYFISPQNKGTCVCKGRKFKASIFPLLGLPMPIMCASSRELASIKGIGKTISKKIKAYYSRHPKAGITDIIKIKGVGPVLGKRLREKLAVRTSDISICKER